MTGSRRTADGSYVDPVEARAELVDALVGVELSSGEARVIEWLLDWDQPTLHHLATLVRKLRAGAS